MTRAKSGRPSRPEGASRPAKWNRMSASIGVKRGELGQSSCFVEEIRSRNFAVGRFQRRISNDQIQEIHLANDVLEGSNIGIGDLVTTGDRAQSWQVLKEIVGQLVTGGCSNDALEIVWLNVPIAVLVEGVESLAYSFAL